MPYRWGDFSLDREGALLTRHGQPVGIPRKTLDCIGHPLERHQCVVGDYGQAQRLIRTMPGLGFRWIAEVVEGYPNGITASAHASETATPHSSRLHPGHR